jgi:hypothetical protein
MNDVEVMTQIVEAKKAVDNAHNQFIEGAITALELQTWVITLLLHIHNFQVEEMLEEGNNGYTKK